MKTLSRYFWSAALPAVLTAGGCASQSSEVSFDQYREWSVSSLCQVEPLVTKGDRVYFLRKSSRLSGQGFNEKVFWYPAE